MESPVVRAPVVPAKPTVPSTLAYDGWNVITVIDPEVPARKRNRGHKASVIKKQIGGPGTFIFPSYGIVRIGATVTSVIMHEGKALLLCVWGEGEIDAVEQLYVNDEAAPSSVTATHYTGTATQAADPWLVAAYAAVGVTYADTLPNIAYSVVRVSPGTNIGYPEVSARLRGLKVPTSDGGTPTFSRVPAYAIANHITNTRYGMASQVDWTSVADCATYNSEDLGSGEYRHLLDMAQAELATAEDWLVAMCDNASIIPCKIGDTWFLIPDAPGTSEVTLTTADYVEGTLRWKRRGPRSTPSVVEVQYTDTSTNPWSTRSAFVYGTGVLEGTADRILQRISKPAITRYSEAYRYGLQLLNEYVTSDLTVSFTAKDTALAWLPGTILTLTAGPFTAKQLRVLTVMRTGPKLYAVTAREYDVGKWSNVVQSAPSTLDTELPSVLSPPTPTGLTVTETLSQLQTGRYASRLYISFDTPTRSDYVFLQGFIVTLTDGTNVFTYDLPHDVRTLTTAPLPENTDYTVSVVARSSVASSSAASYALTTLGKEAVPGDVQSLTAYSVNGETRIFLELGVDLDLVSTELRYSDQVVSAWEDATFLAFLPVPAKSFVTTLVPSGDRRIWAKMRDAVATVDNPNGQESTNAVSYDLTVVPNSTSSTDEYAIESGTLTNMVADGNGGWITAISGDTWNGKFPAAMSTYTSPIASYHTSGSSSLVSATIDTGTSDSCLVNIDGLDYDDLSGTGRVYIEYKVNSGDSWSSVDGTSAAVTARYFRVGVEWTTTETGHIHDLGVLRKTVDNTERFVTDTALNDAAVWML